MKICSNLYNYIKAKVKKAITCIKQVPHLKYVAPLLVHHSCNFKNQRMIAQRIRTRGMMWMAFSANLIRDLSFLAAYERGLYVGSCCGIRETVSELCCFELCDSDGVELMKNSSATREPLDDRCIFGSVSLLFQRKRKREIPIEMRSSVFVAGAD
ncbi:hypothetical protein SCA6_005056 [Theobroma cacao]